MNKTHGTCTKNAKGIQNVRKTKGETRRWEDNIKTDLKEIWEIVNWTHLAQETHWCALLSIIMNHLISKKCG
jgi:hypothetical protein